MMRRNIVNRLFVPTRERRSAQQVVQTQTQAQTVHCGAIERFSPRGGLIMWHQNKKSEWAEGRGLQTEETRCGVLTTLSAQRAAAAAAAETQPPQQRKSATTPLPSPAAPVSPMSAWIKGEPSDWQRSSIGANGDTLFLTRRPKARFNKVAPRKTISLEADLLPEHEPSKQYVDYTVHNGVYTPVIGKLPTDNPVCYFTTYRENKEPVAVADRLRSRVLKSKNSGDDELIHFDEIGTSESYGCITSAGSVVGATKEMLPHASQHYNLRPMIFNPMCYGPLTNSLASDVAMNYSGGGSYNRILLRCVDGTENQIASALEDLSNFGFLNYVPLTQFGIGENSAHEIGATFANGAYRTGLGMFLQTEAETDPYFYDYYKEYLSAEPSTVRGMVGSWYEEMRRRQVNTPAVEFLRSLAEATRSTVAAGGASDGGAAAADGLSYTGDQLRSLAKKVPLWANGTYRQAMRGFLWNAMASQRVLGLPADKVVPGDLVLAHQQGTPAPGKALSGPHSQSQVKVVKTPEEAAQYSVYDIVLPVPTTESNSGNQEQLFPEATGGPTAELYRKFAQLHGLDSVFGANRSDDTSAVGDSRALPGTVMACPAGSAGGNVPASPYRKLVERPLDLEYRILYDPLSQTVLKSDHFLLQERKPLSKGWAGTTRVREPTKLNQSEAVRELLEPVIQAAHREQRKTRFAHRTGSSRGNGNDDGTGSRGHSVALSFSLPLGSHPLSMLREAFNVRHIHYQDLIRPKDVSI